MVLFMLFIIYVAITVAFYILLYFFFYELPCFIQNDNPESNYYKLENDYL
jgi:hypothetical protein